MTEKRFTLKYAERNLIFYDNGEEIGYLDVLDLLNSLNDENERLIKPLKFANDILESLRYINEELKKELDSFKPVMYQDIGKETVLLYAKENKCGQYEELQNND